MISPLSPFSLTRWLILGVFALGLLEGSRLRAESKKILFYAGPASHGWGAHQHPAGGLVLVQAMKRSGLDVAIDLTFNWPDAEALSTVDALVIYSDGWNVHPATDHLDDLEHFMNRGGGLTVIHWATGIGGNDLWTKRNVTQEPVRVRWRGLVGADFEPWHSVSVIWNAGFEDLTDHEVTRGITPFTVWDECYFHLRCSDSDCKHVIPLHQTLPPQELIRPGLRADSGSVSALSAVGERKESQYCSWAFSRPKGGRAFGYTGGHLHWNWARDEVRMLVLNGIYWTSGGRVPDEGIASPRPTAKEMLANLKGNPGWTEEDLQVALDSVAEGTQVKWTAYGAGALPNLSEDQSSRQEAEALSVLNVTGGDFEVQSMNGFGSGLWSRESQLWWRDGGVNDVLELEITVPRSGDYQIGVGMTKAIDYGQVRFFLDGESLKAKAFDGYHPTGVTHSGELLLGKRSLEAGTHQLQLRITGANPKSVKRHMVGIDYLRLQEMPHSSISLFDGTSLKGWSGNRDWWRIENGAIVGEIPAKGSLDHNEFLFWEGTLNDFELRLTYRISGDASANSGVQVRSQQVGDSAAGYQADIDDGALWLGRIYDEHGRGLIAERGVKSDISTDGTVRSTPFRAADDYAAFVHKGGWNEYVIRAVGPHLQTWINGYPAADLSDRQRGQHDYSGTLALQLHSGPGPAKIEFKAIALSHIGETERPPAPSNPKPNRSGISPKGKNLGFESGSFQGWSVSGDVWGQSPIEGDTVTPRRPGQSSNHDGGFWVGGYELGHSDIGTGILRSDRFEVTHRWASFLVGGGSGAQTYVAVLDAVTDSILFQAYGEQTETMRVVQLDLLEHLGEEIYLKVVDRSDGPWGHINFDDFRFHSERQLEIPARVQSNTLLQHLKPNPVAENTHPTVAGMWVPEGFQVDLIATEPTVTQPIAFTFDERGRLWIAEAHSYPQRQPDGEGKDRVIILEDKDGDGTFETKKVFADGLNLVSGIEIGFGGVWIGAAPQLLFLPDRNQDDQLDGAAEVLLDGWGFQDTHETLNSFTWGPDGWLYGNQGVFNHSKIGKPGSDASERVDMRAGVWRYHPLKHQFEIFATGCSNQWGIDFNEMGHLFITHCRSAWGGGPTSYMVQGGHYWNQANAYHAPFIASGQAAWSRGNDSVFRNFLPSSADYGHGEGGAGLVGTRAIHGGHSHVGTMIYLGSNWPETYRDQLFTHNLHGHQMNRQKNLKQGSGYRTIHAGSDQLYTSDPMFIGVDLKYGPDGAVYMIDWVDRQHCHTTNVENWDRSNGRLYRMQWIDSFRPVKVDLRSYSDAKLVNLVRDEDEWYSRMARRLLQERQGKDVLTIIDSALQEDNDTAAYLRLLWTRHLVGGEKPPQAAFEHRADSVRAWAINLSLESQAPEVSRMLSMAIHDPSPVVRLALASALPRIGESIRWELAEVLGSKLEDKGDTFLPKMIWFGLAPIISNDIARAIKLAGTTPMPMLADSIFWFLAKSADGRAALVSRLLTKEAPSSRILQLMSEALDGGSRVPAPEQWTQVVALRKNPQNKAIFDKLGGIFGDSAVLAAMRLKAVDANAPLSERLKALSFLKESGDTECADELVTLLSHPKMMPEVLPVMARFNTQPVAEALVALVPQLDGINLRNATYALSAQSLLAEALLRAVSRGHVERTVLNSFHVRQMRNLGSARVNRLIESVWGRVGESAGSAQDTIEKYRKLYREAPLWAHERADGEALFQLLCASCHRMNGKGADLGPDLTGSWRNGVDYFLENIVDPNVVVGESFRLHVVTKRDGTVVSGMLDKTSDDGITIRTLTERVLIRKSEILSHETLEQSMMPSGILEGLNEDQSIDLLKFLSTM